MTACSTKEEGKKTSPSSPSSPSALTALARAGVARTGDGDGGGDSTWATVPGVAGVESRGATSVVLSSWGLAPVSEAAADDLRQVRSGDVSDSKTATALRSLESAAVTTSGSLCRTQDTRSVRCRQVRQLRAALP